MWPDRICLAIEVVKRYTDTFGLMEGDDPSRKRSQMSMARGDDLGGDAHTRGSSIPTRHLEREPSETPSSFSVKSAGLSQMARRCSIEMVWERLLGWFLYAG